jgi:DNA invertase Pin-like site-specific DNA recombinase
MKNKVYGYLRGSTGDIDKNNQKDAISKVAKSRNIKIEYIEDTVSSGKPYAKRGISNLIDECNKGDSIIVAEVSRFARNTEEMLMISRICLEQGISLEILNPALKFDDSIATKAVIIVMGLASEIERHFIRTRTRQSLAIRKELIEKQGYFLNKKGEKVYQLGAKKGRYQKLKLEPKAGKVLEYRKLKLSNTAIGFIISE